MASDGNDNYMECILKIDTSEGWEKSVTKVLASFQDLAYEINPSVGFIYVRGKTDPQIILMNIMKGGKHATIQWISYGLPKDDQNQFQDPYETYNRFYNPYYPWYTEQQLQQLPHSGLHQGQLLALEHEPSGHSSERRSTSSGSSHCHHHQCPVHPRHNHSPVSSSESRHAPAQNPSPPSVQPEANNDQASNNQSVSKKPSAKSIKKIIGKLRLWLRS